MADVPLAVLARQFALAAARMPRAIHEGLDAAGQLVQDEARGLLGDYQPAVGPFPRWAGLKDSTIRDRLAKGYTANDPLLRSGELRDSIFHERKGSTVFVFSRNPIAAHQEFGTRKMPARPFLGPAMVRRLDDAGREIAARAFAPLMRGN